MKKIVKLASLVLGLSLTFASCSEADLNEAGAGLIGGDDEASASLPATGNATSTGSASTSSDPVSSSNPGGNKFTEFVKSGDTYFGPSGNDASLDSNLSGNAAAGSRFGGPDDAVGILVVVRNDRGVMEVVNLENKNRFPVLFASNNEEFSVPADTLGGKPFPSIFVGEISSLTEFKFDHRISPSPEKCNQYSAKYSGATLATGKYLVTKTGDGACRYTKSGV